MATTAPPVAATATAPSVAELCLAARDASRALAALPTGTKDAALHAIADALEARTAEILEANARDMEAGRANGLDAALLDRLALEQEGKVPGGAERPFAGDAHKIDAARGIGALQLCEQGRDVFALGEMLGKLGLVERLGRREQQRLKDAQLLLPVG